MHTMNNAHYPSTPMGDHYQTGFDTATLLNTVQHCEASCEHMITYIIRACNDDSRDMQLQLLRDCADICTLMAKYLARGSYNAQTLASVCAYICELCGNECSKFQDQMSQNCAQTCLHCARSCKAFAM